MSWANWNPLICLSAFGSLDVTKSYQLPTSKKCGMCWLFIIYGNVILLECKDNVITHQMVAMTKLPPMEIWDFILNDSIAQIVVTHNSKICVWNVYFGLILIFSMFGRVCRFLAQLCGYTGIEYSSPTLASAISNLSPAFTYILAVIFRSFFFILISNFTQVIFVPNFIYL